MEAGLIYWLYVFRFLGHNWFFMVEVDGTEGNYILAENKREKRWEKKRRGDMEVFKQRLFYFLLDFDF